MSIVMHIGTCAKDNQPKRTHTKVSGLFLSLKTPRGSTKDGQYFQLVDYTNGAHRDLEHVTKVYGYVVDLDSDDWSEEEIRDTLDGVRALAYSTFSSTPEAKRWRIVVPFSEPVAVPVFDAIHKFYFVEKFTPGLAGESGKAAQLWYTAREGAHVFTLDGEIFDVSPYYEAAEAPETPRQRANGETRPDHPVFRALDAAGLVLRRGAVLGQWIIRCPWADEHTEGEDGSSSTVYWEPHTGRHKGEGFDCKHGHCLERGIGDVRRKLGIYASGTDTDDVLGKIKRASDLEHRIRPVNPVVDAGPRMSSQGMGVVWRGRSTCQGSSCSISATVWALGKSVNTWRR